MRLSPIDIPVPVNGTQTAGHAFRPTPPKWINKKHLSLTALLLALLTVASQAQTDTQDLDSEIYELSPFTVETSSDVGYLATSSLAGTRINSELKDLGSAISVVTQEFMTDTAATSMEDLLVYTTGTEVGGTSGNFTNSSTSVGRATQEGNRQNPEGNTRVRGLVKAEISRDFYITDFGFDAYNVERIDISRGPNSVLFGVGSPGGVINYSVKQAQLEQDSYELGFRFDHRGSDRETLDLNKVLIDDRFALRINALSETTKYRQEPAYEDDDRFSAALTGVLYKGSQGGFLGRTTAKANYEYAEVKTTPPSVIAPIDTIRDWYMVPDVESITSQTGQAAPSRYTDGSFVPQAMHDALGSNEPFMGSLAQRNPWFITLGQVYSDAKSGVGPSIGFTDPSLSNLQGAEARVQGFFDWEMQSSLIDETWTTGFTANTLSDTSMYDWVNNLLTGRTESREDRFRNQTFSLEQLFWQGNAGIELSYNKQELDRRNQFPFEVGGPYGIVDGRATDIKVDNNLWLGNGEPNPNAGRPLVVSRLWGNHAEIERNRETKRATMFLNLNFEDLIDSGWGRWLGRHVFSGLVEESSLYSEDRAYAMAVSSDDINMEVASNGNFHDFRRQLHGAFYVGPDMRGIPNYEDVHFDGYIDVPYPKAGDEYVGFIRDPVTDTIKTVTAYTEEFLKTGSANRRIIDTKAFTVQSHLVDGTVVGMFGYRDDRVRDTLSHPAVLLDSGALDPASLLLQDSEDLDVSGSTTSWSIVAHYPEQWLPELPWGSNISLFYSNSENFTPVGFRQDVLLNPLDSPSGTTREHGFLISLLHDKMSLRVNWYKTENANVALDTNLPNLAVEPIVASISRLMDAQNAGLPFGYDYVGAETGLGNYYNSYEEVYDLFLNMVPDPMRSAADVRITTTSSGVMHVESTPVDGLTSTSNLVAEGMEIELVANPLPNWTLLLNAAKQETVRTGSGSELSVYFGEIRESLIAAHLWNEDVRDGPFGVDDMTYKQRLIRDFLNPIATITAKDGAVSAEQRKWRMNFTTAYRFTNIDMLDGLTVGGSLRWQDKAAAGYPINLVESEGDVIQQPDLDHPWYTPEQTNGDLFVRYTRQLTDKLTWTIQLNARNVIGDQDIQVETINPDGTPAVYRAPVERTFLLSNTFSF